MDVNAAPSILYAEDDENDVFFVNRAFSKLQFGGIKVAENGRDAVEYLQRANAGAASAPLPAVMLLDLNLPYLNGHDVLEWVRKQPQFRALPVVVFTSSAQLTDIERAYRAGATAYVVKPSAAPTMVDFARHILRAVAAPEATRSALATFSGFCPPPPSV